jgi:AraC-like DNA-binding protein
MEKIGSAMLFDKLYLDVDLTLAKLAEHIASSPKIVSAVLNQRTGKGFNEYVNKFRIEEVKIRLSEGDNKKYTITAVAYDCGFNSQPTFQRAFKSHVGLTPREFLNQKG